MSKGLEALEKAKNRNGLPLNENFAPITEREIEIIEKELKALEIIKKIVDINNFLLLFRDMLTNEEYDLLKEVLI